MNLSKKKYTTQWFHSNLKKLFPDLAREELMCEMYLGLVKEVHIDAIAFWNELESVHGEIPDGTSVYEFVVEKYGQEARDWLESAI